MTFYDAINELLKIINFKITYPISIVMGLKNSHYIDLKIFDLEKILNLQEILDKKLLNDNDIDTILHNPIPDSNDLSVVWLDHEHKINMQSFNNLYKFTSSDKSDSIRKFLKPYMNIGTILNKYDIYLYLLPDDKKVTIDGIAYENDEIQLPDFQHFKYQNLYAYEDKEKFVNAVLIEFLVRNARYNGFLSDMTIIEESFLEGETDEEYDFRTMLLLQEQERKIDDILLQNYGLSLFEIQNLDLTIFKNTGIEDEENIVIELSTLKPPHRDIVLDPSLPEEEFLKKAKYLKNKYEEEKNNYFPLKERLNNEYLMEAMIVINKFPKNFYKLKDQLIKSLFIFDYIQALEKTIDYLNIITNEKYKDEKKELDKYDISLDQKKIDIM